MKNLIIVIIILLQSLAVFGHQDVLLKLEDDGSLVGLPEQYSNASFDCNTFTLIIGENKITVPECVKKYFGEISNSDITFSASWYHRQETLPYYINLEVTSSGHQILFNLETLDIILFRQPELIYNECDAIRFDLDLKIISKECQIEISNSIIKN